MQCHNHDISLVISFSCFLFVNKMDNMIYPRQWMPLTTCTLFSASFKYMSRYIPTLIVGQILC